MVGSSSAAEVEVVDSFGRRGAHDRSDVERVADAVEHEFAAVDIHRIEMRDGPAADTVIEGDRIVMREGEMSAVVDDPERCDAAFRGMDTLAEIDAARKDAAKAEKDAAKATKAKEAAVKKAAKEAAKAEKEAAKAAKKAETEAKKAETEAKKAAQEAADSHINEVYDDYAWERYRELKEAGDL